MRRLAILLLLASPSLTRASEPPASKVAEDDADSAPKKESETPPDGDAPTTPAPSSDAEEPSAVPSEEAAAIALARADLDALTAALLAEDAEPAAPAAEEAPLLVERMPDALGSEAPVPVAAPEPKPDVAWLEGVALPDLPVRWHRALVDILKYYRDDPRGRAHIRTWLQRSGRYATMIRAKLRAAELPEDLLYVVMVESGYDPTVVSSAGAVGLWQMVEATSGDYGIETNRWVDERRDPEKATDAAAKYLKDLYAKLGSWPLSLAAFNMGYGALQRSIRKYNTNDFWLLSRVEAGLPYETVTYVAKIMACAIVAHNQERFGLADLKLDAPAATATVQAPGGTGLGRLASAASISVEALSALNPELLRKRLPPDVKEWSLRIPGDKLERFTKRFGEQKAEPRSHGTHVLRFGERAKDVAEMYGTTERKLRALNDLSDDEVLRPGARLIVPDVEPQAPAKDPSTEKVVVGVPEQAFDYPDRKRIFYAPVQGDNPTEIAKFFQVTLDELRLWNDVSTDAKLHSGMTLQLYVPETADLSGAIVLAEERVETFVVGSEAFFDYHEAQRDRARVRYKVKVGDTMVSLANRFDLSVGSIARINHVNREKALPVDSEIILYVPNKDVAKLDTQTARSAHK